MSERENPTPQEEASFENQREDSKRRLYFVLAAVVCVMLPFGAMRVGKLTGMGSGQVQCTPKYTGCVLGCNKKSVEYSQKVQSSLSVKQRSKWERRLVKVQTRCIPMCYQIHCMGKTPKAAAKALEPKKKASR